MRWPVRSEIVEALVIAAQLAVVIVATPLFLVPMVLIFGFGRELGSSIVGGWFGAFVFLAVLFLFAVAINGSDQDNVRRCRVREPERLDP